MKATLKSLRGKRIERLRIESVDLSLYIAHAQTEGREVLLADPDGRILKTRNLLEMKEKLAPLKAEALVLTQRSPYDEMVGQGFAGADNSMEIRLGPGYESLPPWRH
jgi:hypothetical protein